MYVTYFYTTKLIKHLFLSQNFLYINTIINNIYYKVLFSSFRKHKSQYCRHYTCFQLSELYNFYNNLYEKKEKVKEILYFFIKKINNCDNNSYKWIIDIKRFSPEFITFL